MSFHSLLDLNYIKTIIYTVSIVIAVCNLQTYTHVLDVHVTMQAEIYDPCSSIYVENYLNTKQVQKALHAKPTKWEACRYNFHLNQSNYSLF